MNTQLTYNYVILAFNGASAILLVWIMNKMVVPFEAYQGQMTMISQMIEALRAGLNTKEGRTLNIGAIFTNYIIPLGDLLATHDRAHRIGRGSPDP